ncbi:NAD-dependent epimerase/dehydratase family protein [Halapricum hydrolyticum]|uniref:NAD-dependent epimerase/dehydratase family protein n=1 Tax=Halapricum hydrolyticum TaxID=2979991 RepID=A0AAE3LEI3_9EURY|nr:NAD-dependent epimerase/dehydratase family protein [Halapricum hydrolyticum]MCU4718158.1 NAD-dependent epimerase/dehydratase family protein [Halapricum hydrolyticum]MCU4726422.1 NAD-dependent epimerase/dehydratase family protein [Halapricum hydrolyticum]
MAETDLTGRTILITGGAGFIGSHIADALTTDNDVTVLDDLSSGSRENVPDGATFIEGDVRDDDTLKNAAADADVIFHEAAIVSVQQSIDQPQRCQDVNLTGTLAVLEAARREDARVVFASSAAIYGEPTGVPIDEAEPTAPASPYGIDKCAADQYVRTYHDLYGLDTVALRYFNVYGPGQTGGDYSGVISIFREQALTGDPITVDGDGSQTRDFVHVEDVVRANLLAATTDAVGTAYNIGTGTETSIQTLAETVQSIADTDSPIVHGEPRPGDIDRSCADVTRAREQLGYEPKISLEEGLRTLF